MRHKNSVKQLNRSYAHRKAMMGNMVTSLFQHERIVTTKQKGKVLKKMSEKIISRAKKNLQLKENDKDKILHNKREVMKLIKDRSIIKKLFENIAPRFKDRNGGYTRLYLLGRRPGDAAEMAIVELVDRVSAPVKEEKKAKKKTEDKKDDEKKTEKKKGFSLKKSKDKKEE
jgi:large subunit ribosomal protein L17